MRKLRSHMRWNYTNRTCEARAIGAQTKTILCANFTKLSSNIHILCPSSSGILHKWSSVSPMNHKCGGFFATQKKRNLSLSLSIQSNFKWSRLPNQTIWHEKTHRSCFKSPSSQSGCRTSGPNQAVTQNHSTLEEALTMCLHLPSMAAGPGYSSTPPAWRSSNPGKHWNGNL